MKKGEKTKTRLLLAAEKLLLKKDIFKVSVLDIAKEAGVAKGTFYLYFETKEDIIIALIDKCLNQMESIINRACALPVSFLEIDRLIDNFIISIKENRDVLEILHKARVISFINLNNRAYGYTSMIMNPIIKWIKKGKEDNVFDVSDPEITGHFIFSAVHDLIDHIILNESTVPINVLGEEIKIIIRKILICKH